MSDLLKRLRDMAAGKSDGRDIAAEAIEEIIDLNWRVVQLEEERDELRAQIAVTDDRERTHSNECWRWHGHHACAIARVERLEAQIAAHERECAGKWVKVTERLPDRLWQGPVITESGVLIQGFRVRDGDFGFFQGHQFIKAFSPIALWLDARLPGEE